MSNPLTIQVARQHGPKSQIKNVLGIAASLLYRKRFLHLSANPDGRPKGFVDKVMMSLLKRQAILQGNEQFFEMLHKDFWQGEGGEIFSSNCDHRFEDLFLNQQKEDLIALKNQWRLNDLNRIVEFGCNSGLVLNYLTQTWRAYCKHKESTLIKPKLTTIKPHISLTKEFSFIVPTVAIGLLTTAIPKPSLFQMAVCSSTSEEKDLMRC